MTTEPKWIRKQTLLLLHATSLKQFGGSEGLRDEGLLDSALARPLNLFAYEEVNDLCRLAASYAYGIARNHPFIDGNKRAAFLSIGLFLFVNGFEVQFDQASAVANLMQLADGSLPELALANWIRNSAGTELRLATTEPPRS